MYFGWPSLCLDVKDLDRATHFYQAIGMQLLPEASEPGLRTVLRTGGFRLGLFAGIGGNCINFRGADVVAAHASLLEAFPTLVGQPATYVPSETHRADGPGTSWLTADPDGNGIFFDTLEGVEEGESFKRARVREILADAAQELESLGASECLEVLRREVMDRFAEPG